MNAGELHKLVRQLREIASDAITKAGEVPPSPGVVAVAEDITQHPGSTIGEIVGRVRLAQSFVSKTVAELRDEGIVVTTPDPHDGRRVCVTLSPSVKQELFIPRGQTDLAKSVTKLHPQLTPAEVARVSALLDELSALLKTSSN